jgi:hypothetical protein
MIWAGEHQTVVRGPVTLTVRTDKKEIQVAEPLRLMIAVTGAAGVSFEMPDLREGLKAFQVQSRGGIVPRTCEDGRVERSQTFVLEAYVGGECQIPPLTVRVLAEGSPPATQASASRPAQEISSEPFTVKVRSVLSGEADPTAFRDIKGPVVIAWSNGIGRWAAGAGVIAVAAAGVWWIHRRRRPAPEVVIPPWEQAHRELDVLLADDLIRLGRVQEFYYRLSTIVREYIERQFSITAPEMTTEEFLRSLERDRRLAAQERVLSEFLRSCDVVKYARALPSPEEIRQVVAAARNMVDETAHALPVVKFEDSLLEDGVV